MKNLDTRPLGEPPTCFDEHLRNIWAEIVRIAPAGRLVRSSCFWLELACRLLSEIRAGDTPKGKQRLLKQMLGKIDLELSADHGTLMRRTSASRLVM